MDNKKLDIVRVTAEGRTNTEDVVARELPVTIFLNDEELVTMLCSPAELDCLAVGFLSSEGLLKDRGEIKDIAVDEAKGTVRIYTTGGGDTDRDMLFKRMVTSGCGRGVSFLTAADIESLAMVESQMTISAAEAFALVREFQHHSPTFLKTGGVHSAALCDNSRILVFAEDIGRHNAIDKIFGRCILEGIATDDRMVVTSGRIPSEILLKVAKRQVPIIISVSAPTNVGVSLARSLGITLVGFVRGKRMNVYTHDWRVT